MDVPHRPQSQPTASTPLDRAHYNVRFDAASTNPAIGTPPRSHGASSVDATSSPMSNVRASHSGESTKFLQHWEENARLEDSQLERIARIAGELPHLMDTPQNSPATPKDGHSYSRRQRVAYGNKSPVNSEETKEGAKEIETGTDRQEDIENMQQFYSWFAAMAAEGRKEEEEKYGLQMERVTSYSKCAEDLLTQINDALHFLEKLQSEYQIVSTKTGELHRACESLVQEKDQLVGYADNLRGKLSYFDELDRITARFNSASLSVLDEQFIPLLQRLDECIAFVKENPNFYQSEIHLLKFQQLQNRGLTITKNHIVTTLRNTTATIQANIKPGERADNALLSAKFRAVSSKLRPLCVELEKRAASPEYNALLQDCHACYFQQRKQLLMATTQAVVYNLALTSTDLPAMMRSSCSYMLQLCQQEYQLYHHFFATQSLGLSRGLLEGFSSMLYETVRPLVIHSYHIDTLCTLTRILKMEIIHDQMLQRGESVAAFHPVVVRLLEDVQERLCFLVQTYIRDDIASYVPKPQDLDYPKKLQQQQQQPEAKPDAKPEGNAEDSADSAVGAVRLSYSSWYPTLASSLLCLSKLSLAHLDHKIFEALAQEVVAVCTNSLINPSKAISKAQGVMHGQLFLVRHLLILREQITPFDINFSSMEKSLDFSHVKDAMSRVLSGSGSVFTLAPRMRSSETDAKKELEAQLIQGIQAFIMLVLRNVMDDLLSFLTQTNALLNAIQARKGEGTSAKADVRLPQPEKLIDVLNAVNVALDKHLPSLLDTLDLYLHKTASKANRQNILTTLKDNMLQYVAKAFELGQKLEWGERMAEVQAVDPRPKIVELFQPHMTVSSKQEV